MTKRSFGWKRSLPDHRDVKYASIHSELCETLPSQVDLRDQMSPVENQGNLGSCVANALVGALEFLELQELSLHMPTDASAPEEFDAYQFYDLSRLFVYFNARYIDGDVSQDAGTMTRSAVQAIQKWGVCRENLWPYHPHSFAQTPLPAAFKEAASHKIVADYKIDNTVLHQMLTCLALGFPFVFGISVYDSFLSDEVASTGHVPMPGADESIQGGHALCCVGYDLDQKRFIFRNSWGADWGDCGYGYIPFEYLTSRDLCDDVWTIRKNSPKA